MTRITWMGLIALLVACGGKGADDSGPTAATATGAGTGAGVGTGAGTGGGTGVGTGTGTGTGTTDVFDVTVLAPNQSCGPDPGGQTLDLTGLSERIDVIHIGVPGSVCAQWDVTAVATTSEGRIDVSYTDTFTGTCGTPCWWTIEYFLNDLPPGDWTVYADTAVESTTVLP